MLSEIVFKIYGARRAAFRSTWRVKLNYLLQFWLEAHYQQLSTDTKHRKIFRHKFRTANHLD